MDEKIIYGILLAGAGIVLALAVLSLIVPPAAAQRQGSGTQAASGQVPPECGNIKDPANIQHLSHHPDRYQQCYQFIDPAKFKAATGQDISNFIR